MSAQLANLIASNLSEEDFATLCFLLGEDADNFSGGLADKATALVAKIAGDGRLDELVATAGDVKPEVSWPSA